MFNREDTDCSVGCGYADGNMASIQRQLNLYGFRCTNRIDEKGVFCHPNFVRGQYDEVRNIRRKKTWPTKRKPKVDANAAATTAATTTSYSPTTTSSSCSGYSVANPSCSGYQDYCPDYCSTTMDAQQGNDSPLTCLLTSDEFLMDLFDDGKTFDDENILLNAFGSGDFDQSLFSVFAEDTFPQGTY
jgi:hypothetical protein